MIIFLLIIIAVGVLLITNQGKALLSFFIKWSILLIILIVIIIILVVGYSYLNSKNENRQVEEKYSTTNNVAPTFLTDIQYSNKVSNKKICDNLPTTERQKGVAPSGTIDAEALTINSYSESSRITGTFKNTGGIQVYIWKGDIKIPSPLPENFSPTPVSVDFSDHGGELDYCPVGSGSGRYFSEIRKTLQKGLYTVGVYTYDNIYTDEGYQGNTPSLMIASGTLRILN